MDALGQKLFRGEFASAAERDDLYRQMTQKELVAPVRVWLASVVNSFPATSDADRGHPTSRPARARRGRSGRPTCPGSTRSRWATCGSGPSAPPGTPSAASAMSTASTSGATCSTRRSRTTPSRVSPSRSGPSYDGEHGRVRPASWTCPPTRSTWDATNDAWVPVAAGHPGDQQGDLRLLPLPPVPLARRPAHHHRGRRLLHRAGLRPRLRPGQGSRSRSPSRPRRGRTWTRSRASASPTTTSSRCTSTTGTSTRTRSRPTPARPRCRMPWEILAAMDDLVFDQRRAAYSDTAAARYDVPWLSLVMTRDAKLVDRTLRQFSGRGTVPGGRVPDGRPDAGHARTRRRPATRRPRTGSTSTVTWSSATARSSWRATTRRRSSRSWTRSATRPTRSRPPTSTWASRRTLSIDPLEGATVGIGPGGDHPRCTVQGPGTLALRYLLIDPAHGQGGLRR